MVEEIQSLLCHIGHARTVLWHAYLLNCLDSELSLQLDCAIAATTPVVGANSSALPSGHFHNDTNLLAFFYLVFLQLSVLIQLIKLDWT